jgi:hypothetical protein
VKAVKVIIRVVLLGVGGWLVFAAFWNVLGTQTSPDLYFALRFGIGLLCLSSGFSMIDRAAGFQKWRKDRREGRRLKREQQPQASGAPGLVMAGATEAPFL